MSLTRRDGVGGGHKPHPTSGTRGETDDPFESQPGRAVMLGSLSSAAVTCVSRMVHWQRMCWSTIPRRACELVLRYGSASLLRAHVYANT